jgi:hypothetical protein
MTDICITLTAQADRSRRTGRPIARLSAVSTSFTPMNDPLVGPIVYGARTTRAIRAENILSVLRIVLGLHESEVHTKLRRKSRVDVWLDERLLRAKVELLL